MLTWTLTIATWQAVAALFGAAGCGFMLGWALRMRTLELREPQGRWVLNRVVIERDFDNEPEPYI